MQCDNREEPAIDPGHPTISLSLGLYTGNTQTVVRDSSGAAQYERCYGAVDYCARGRARTERSSVAASTAFGAASNMGTPACTCTTALAAATSAAP